MKGKYRLLIVVGHSSHLAPDSNQYCTDNDIAPICICLCIIHSSYLLQAFHVGYFAVLKRALPISHAQRHCTSEGNQDLRCASKRDKKKRQRLAN
jgi:hypothetical protein